MALLPMAANADTVEIDGIYYNLIKKVELNYAEVTSNPNDQTGDYYSGNIVIPESVSYDGNDYGVTSIGGSAFNHCTSLTSITIPNSVTSIGRSAFLDCPSLTSITIPNSLTSIGESVFWGCTSLTSITIPNSVTNIGGGAFYGCTSLTSITIPNSVTSIGSGVFSHCTSLTSITIPNSVTSIGTSAFYDCTSLTNITIPNSVTSIGDNAFQGCSSLTTITIPNSVTSIGESAFWGCIILSSITIPNSVTNIRRNTFYGCTSLTSITIPNSVTKIGRKAFYGCTNITSITFTKSVSGIEEFAFGNIPELSDVFCYGKYVPIINTKAFEGSFIEYATLHVPAAYIDIYKVTDPWKNFMNIVVLEGDETPTTPKCEKPTIRYENGQLNFACATEGAEFVSEIADTDIKKYNEASIQLSVTYVISVYATKSGYENSDVATATLCWIDQQPQAGGTANDMSQVSARAVMISSNGGSLTIDGADDGTPIAAYATTGHQAGSAVSTNGRAVIATTLQPGSIAIVKIGQKSVKVIVK